MLTWSPASRFIFVARCKRQSQLKNAWTHSKIVEWKITTNFNIKCSYLFQVNCTLCKLLHKRNTILMRRTSEKSHWLPLCQVWKYMLRGRQCTSWNAPNWTYTDLSISIKILQKMLGFLGSVPEHELFIDTIIYTTVKAEEKSASIF